MKRIFTLFLCVTMLIGSLVLPIAASEPEEVVISQTVEDLGNGYYVIETITVPAVQAYSGKKTGTKTSSYVFNDTVIFMFSITGIFVYDGSTSQATAANGNKVAYVDGVTFGSNRAYVSGSSAIFVGTATYLGITIPKTVTLTCDKDGNLS